MEISEVAKDFIAGTFAGCAGILTGHPFDTVKVRLQTQSHVAGVKPTYSGTLNCFVTIVKTEKVAGLYKGMASPMAGVAFINALLFGVYGNVLRLLEPQPPQLSSSASTTAAAAAAQGPAKRPSVKSIFLAGAASGLVNSFVSCPIELMKTRLQIQTESPGATSPASATKAAGMSASPLAPKSSLHYHTLPPHARLKPSSSASSSFATAAAAGKPEPSYTGPWDCFKKTLHMQGVRGIYRGMVPTMLREVPSYGVYFAAYELLCLSLCKEKETPEHLGPVALMFAGGMSGICGWLSTYPADVVKSRMQADSLYNPQYKGFADCIRKSFQAEGGAIFFRGLNATIVRAFPTNAATFAVYTLCMRLMGSGSELDAHQHVKME